MEEKTKIEAIETKYRGIKFRSKLEAQWAVYLDECGADWEYEPEGYDCGDGVWYLPDFLVHNASYEKEGSIEDITGDLWIEVKGIMDERSKKKLSYFIWGNDAPECMGHVKKILNRTLIVGRLPFSSDFLEEQYDSINLWKKRNFECEWFYILRTVNNYGWNITTFPVKSVNGGITLQTYDCLHEFNDSIDFNGTLNALETAINYQFTNKERKAC